MDFIAGSNDSADQPLGHGDMRLFDWYFDGDTPVRHYEAAAESRGVPSPPFKLSRGSAEVFDELIESGGAFVTGRQTYDISGAWGGNGPLPGLPVFVVTHSVPHDVPVRRKRLHLRYRWRRERHHTSESGNAATST